MEVPRSILTPSQRQAIIRIGSFIRSGHHHASLVAPRGNGTTHLMQYLSATRGIDDHSTEFIHIQTQQAWRQAVASLGLRNDHAPKSHRLILLVDHPLNSIRLSSVKNATIIQATLADAKRPDGAVISMQPLTADQQKQYLESHQFTIRGKRVKITRQAFTTLHQITQGRISSTVQIIQDALKDLHLVNQTVLHSRIISDHAPGAAWYRDSPAA